jgi:hypothetical protein
MYSTPLLGTATDKLTWIDYYWNSCIMQGWYNFRTAFNIWGDLMGSNYEDYALLKGDDPLSECLDYFWDSLEDDIYPKAFLDHLIELSNDVKSGKEKTYKFSEIDWADLDSW